MKQDKIINFVKKITGSKLFSGSLIMILGSLAGGFLNFLFHLFMGRQLGPEDYGVLASLISVNYLLGVPTGTLSLVIVKHVSAWRGEQKTSHINYFYHWLSRKMFFLAFGGSFVILLASPFVSRFLHLDSVPLLWLTGASFLIGIFALVNTAVFQSFLRFDWQVAVGLAINLAKLAASIFLVFLGWRVYGPMVAILVSSIVGWVWSSRLAGKLVGSKVTKTELDIRELLVFSLPAFLSTLALTSLYTTDVVLARHFLPQVSAGFYAALSTLGKIVFFATSPVASVMFPIISERHAAKKDFRIILALALLLISAVSVGLGLAYYLFPELMVSLLYGRDYLPVAGLLWLFAVAMGLYSLCAALVNYYLSVRHYRILALPVAAALFQAGLISFYHQSIRQIALVCVFVMLALLAFLVIPLFRKYRRQSSL